VLPIIEAHEAFDVKLAEVANSPFNTIEGMSSFPLRPPPPSALPLCNPPSALHPPPSAPAPPSVLLPPPSSSLPPPSTPPPSPPPSSLLTPTDNFLCFSFQTYAGYLTCHADVPDLKVLLEDDEVSPFVLEFEEKLGNGITLDIIFDLPVSRYKFYRSEFLLFGFFFGDYSDLLFFFNESIFLKTFRINFLRPSRYQDMIQKILVATPKEHPDHALLLEALTLITKQLEGLQTEVSPTRM
jgi:hypothetical protein